MSETPPTTEPAWPSCLFLKEWVLAQVVLVGGPSPVACLCAHAGAHGGVFLCAHLQAHGHYTLVC